MEERKATRELMTTVVILKGVGVVTGSDPAEENKDGDEAAMMYCTIQYHSTYSGIVVLLDTWGGGVTGVAGSM